MSKGEMRQYIRHPTNIPIECSIAEIPLESRPQMRNVSRNGLSFTSGKCIAPGSNIHLRIPLNDVEFDVIGVVMWCHDNDEQDGQYEMGVKFTSDETEYSVRMIEQMCHIEQYRQQIQQREGRQLSSEEASKEWMEKFAADFPQ